MGENGLLEKVKQAINSNATVKGLMKDFRDIGIKVKNELEAVILAEDYWIKINDIERGPLEKYKVSELKELPFTSVRNNGIEYRIHGITHDTVNKKLLSAKTKDFYREAIFKLSDSKDGENCLCEPGMLEVFGLKNVNGISIGELFPYDIKTYLYFFLDTLKLNVIRKNLSEETLSMMFKNDMIVGEAVYKTRSDINYLPLLREAYKRQLFPMPLEIEKRNVKCNIYAAIADKFACKFLNYRCHPALSRHYTSNIKEFIQTNKPRILHFVSGLTHEAEVTYYIKNRRSLAHSRNQL